MGREINPFKVGQVVEVRTFEEGFRGAWFRGKIKTLSMKKGRLGHTLEYFDFPEEELKWTTLYQATFCNDRRKNKELMLRPHYPPIYNEKQMPNVSEISEVTAIVADSLRVGDLVDWWNADCYWSGTITQLLGDNKVQIELKPPPHGEGLSYEALPKDLRPSLDWSPELGWTVPTQEGDTGRPCARLVKPTNQGQETEAVRRPAGSSGRSVLSSPVPSNSEVSDKAKSRTKTGTQTRSLGETVSKKQKEKQDRSTSLGPVNSSTRIAHQGVADSGQNGVEPSARSVLSSPVPSNSEVSDKTRSRTKTGTQTHSLGETLSKKQEEKQDRSTSLGPVDSSTRIAHQGVADSGQKGVESAADVAEDEQTPDYPQKKNRRVLRTEHSNTLEAVVLDLEENLNKVKWLRKILKYGTSSSNAQGPQWQFV